MAKSTKIVIVSFIVSAVILALALASSLYLRAEGEHKNCENINEVRSSLIDILTRSEQLALSNAEYTPLEKKAAVIFYTHALKDLEPTSC